jgi:hypothetical protein
MNSYLEDMAPVLALVVEPFIDHLHDLYEIVSENRRQHPPFRNNNDTCVPFVLNWLYVSCAISFIWVPDGPQGSFEVASRTLAWVSEYPFV